MPLAKQCKLSFPLSTSNTSNCFDIVHMDIWGPIAIPSLDGFQYFLTIVDDYSRYTWTLLMHNKSETRLHIKNFISYCNTQFHSKIKTIRSDNGTEFIMPSYYASLGIIHQRSCVETPQQNSVVERKHRHLLNVTRSLLFHAHLPKNFWSYALCHATF